MLLLLTCAFALMDTQEKWGLELELLSLIGTGNASIAKTTDLARRIAAACDNVPQHVRELAMLPNDSHRERDLHRWVGRQVWRDILPQPYDFDIPITRDGIHEEPGVHSALLPHESFHTLHQYRELFDHMMIGDVGTAPFWQGIANTAWYQNHPLEQVRSDPEHCVPVRMYGDDAGLFQNQKTLVLLWGSAAVSNRLTLDSRILFTAINYLQVVPARTLNVNYKVWAWSLMWLALGIFPDVDHDGIPFSLTYHPERFATRLQPLAGGMIGVWGLICVYCKWNGYVYVNGGLFYCRVKNGLQLILTYTLILEASLRSNPTKQRNEHIIFFSGISISMVL